MADSSALFRFSFVKIITAPGPPSSPSFVHPFASTSPFSVSPWRSSSDLCLSRPNMTRNIRSFASRDFLDKDANFGEDDSFGSYPWDHRADSGEGIQWLPEDRVTLFTSDGLIQIGGSLVPRRIPSSDKQGQLRSSQRLKRFQESSYMDPDQGLCLGALFDIAATNGLDNGRRLCIFGFCRSIEMLSDVVEDTVLEHGGEVVAAEKAMEGGLHEKLSMTVAVPLLWGIPPASDTLHVAVRSGGGIIEKMITNPSKKKVSEELTKQRKERVISDLITTRKHTQRRRVES